mgnify:CR=1 FL=1
MLIFLIFIFIFFINLFFIESISKAAFPTGEIKLNKINSEKFQIHYKIKKGTWAGFGFGESMKNADINYIIVDSFGKFDLHDTFSFGHGRPKDDKDQGGTFDFENIRSFKGNNDFINIIFERKFDTKDKFDKKLEPVNII